MSVSWIKAFNPDDLGVQDFPSTVRLLNDTELSELQTNQFMAIAEQTAAMVNSEAAQRARELQRTAEYHAERLTQRRQTAVSAGAGKPTAPARESARSLQRAQAAEHDAESPRPRRQADPRERHLDDAGLFYRCEVDGCTCTFEKCLELDQHKWQHVDEDLRPPFKCDSCDFYFPNKINLAKHVQRQHSPLERFKCPYPGCDKSYTRKDNLRVHWNNEHKNKST
jgi:hypothetical protein